MGALGSTAEIAALMGDPARANMLFTLLDSDTATAGDLSIAANVAPSTASEHLAKLVAANLIAATKDGRRRYYRLTSERVGDVLAGLERLAEEIHPDGPMSVRGDESVLHARGCCDHLAGWLGVGVTEAIIAQGHVRQRNGGLVVSTSGDALFNHFGLDMEALRSSPRRLVTLCHDWSENAFHFGGSFAGALLQGFYGRDWLRRQRGEASVRITPTGRAGFREFFDLEARDIGG